jgi:hypothetical protein
VRRALLLEWPAITFLYGLMPWHVDGRETLTWDELEQYRLQAKEFSALKAR